MAGCSALIESDGEQPTEQSSDLADGDPEKLVEQFLESVAAERELRTQMFHSEIAGAYEMEIRDTTVVKEDLSTTGFRDLIPLSRDEAEGIIDDAETAVIEVEQVVSERGTQVEETNRFVLATEEGNWRIVGVVPTGDANTGQAESETTESEPSPEPGIPQSVHEYLVENETQGYDGTLVDRRGTDSVTVEVGAGENGFAFSPPVLTVAAGTEVVWEWTGLGGAHNVVSTDAPEAFSSGEVISEDGHTWSRVFETTGNYMYHCQPHHALGMHGAIIVE